MEPIIKKAIEGGFDPSYWDLAMKAPRDLNGLEVMRLTLDPLFWQALGKACGWKPESKDYAEWLGHALQFHEINLTEGWEQAVAYLLEVTK